LRPLAPHLSPKLSPSTLGSGLFFATAEALEDRVRELAEADSCAPRRLVLDLRAVNFIDSQGAEKLTEIQHLIETRGGTLRLAHIKP
jgi:SulP family sulfate permease